MFTADVFPLVNLDFGHTGKAHCSTLLVVHCKSSGVIFIVRYSLEVYSWFANTPPVFSGDLRVIHFAQIHASITPWCT